MRNLTELSVTAVAFSLMAGAVATVPAQESSVERLDRLETEVAELREGLARSGDRAETTRFPAGMVVAFDGRCPSGWTEHGQARGRFILGSGGDYALGKTGGEASHRLTTAELPHYEMRGEAGEGTHLHELSTVFSIIDGGDTSPVPRAGKSDNGRYRASMRTSVEKGEHTHDVKVSSGGGDEPHNNMPPFIVLSLCTPLG